MDERARVFDQIRQTVKSSRMWSAIQRGDTGGMCGMFASTLYEILQQPEHRIDGLSLAVVEKEWDRIRKHGHVWLAAYHPACGFFLIDPAVGQFMHEMQSGEPFKDVFIGTFDELSTMVSSGTYKLDGLKDMHQAWAGPLNIYGLGWSPTPFYHPDELQTLWKTGPFLIEPPEVSQAGQVGR